MKKLQFFLIALTLLFALIGGGIPRIGHSVVYAAATAQVNINAPAEVTVGQNFIVRVDIAGVENLDACNYDISFNPQVLQIVDSNTGTPELNAGDGLINSVAIPVEIVNVIHQGTGPSDLTVARVVENIAGLTGVSGSGYLAELHFKAIAAGTTNIGISNGVLSNVLAESIPATWTGDSVNASIPTVSVLRNLPASVVKGQTFDVTVTFSAPADNFNAFGISDFAPTGWTVQVDKTWNNPPAIEGTATNNQAQYIWGDTLNQGQAVTALYKVTVPATATPGIYNFTNGTLQYYIGQAGPTTVNITGASQVEVVEGARVQGETWEVKGVILGNVTLILDGATSVVSDAQGVYQLYVTTTGQHTIVASKTGFKNYTRTFTVNSMGDVVTLDFKALYGLVPNAPNMTYVLNCINKWKFPPEGLGLNMTKVLAVINAWKFPVHTLNPTIGPVGTVITVSGGLFVASTEGVVWFDTNGNNVLDVGEPSAAVTTTATGALPAGVTLTVPQVAAGTYQVRADIPAGGTVEAAASFVVIQ